MLRVLQQTPGYVQLEEVPKLSQPSQVTEAHPPPRCLKSIEGVEGWGGLKGGGEDGRFFVCFFFGGGLSNERMRGKGRFWLEHGNG